MLKVLHPGRQQHILQHRRLSHLQLLSRFSIFGQMQSYGPRLEATNPCKTRVASKPHLLTLKIRKERNSNHKWIISGRWFITHQNTNYIKRYFSTTNTQQVNKHESQHERHGRAKGASHSEGPNNAEIVVPRPVLWQRAIHCTMPNIVQQRGPNSEVCSEAFAQQPVDLEGGRPRTKPTVRNSGFPKFIPGIVKGQWPLIQLRKMIINAVVVRTRLWMLMYVSVQNSGFNKGHK